MNMQNATASPAGRRVFTKAMTCERSVSPLTRRAATLATFLALTSHAGKGRIRR